MDSSRDFGFLLRDVSRLSLRNFERHAVGAKLGLTLEECRVLVNLQRDQGVTHASLALITDIAPMTLLRILDRMERRRWVERRPDVDDRRLRRLYLRPAAKPLLARIWAIGDRVRAESLAGLGAADRRRLLAFMQRVRDNLLALKIDPSP